MSRYLQRSALLCLFALCVAACSGGAVTPGGAILPAASDGAQTGTSPIADARRVKRPRDEQITIQGNVTDIEPRPWYHVVVNVDSKRIPIYTSELKAAKIGYIVKAHGFLNSLGNFQAAWAAIVSTGSSPSPSSSPTPSSSPKPISSPTPSSSPKPISSPTPSSSPKPISSPTPGISPKPIGSPIPSSSTVAGVIKQFQVFDYDITAAQSTSNAPNMSMVWGAGIGNSGANPKTWLAGNSQLAATQYVVQPTDHYAVSKHNLAWWQANHPDWIVYDCDGNNNPTRTVAYQPGLPQDVPLDIHNPSVVAYQMQTAGAFAIAHGANAIAADQTLFFDYDGGQQPGWFGCGIYSRGGTFIRRWGAAKGGFPNYDPQWNHDVAAWVANAKAVLTTDAVLAPHHLKLFVNHPAESPTNSDEQTLVANVDGVLNETGFVDYGRYAAVPSLFKTTLAHMEYVQAQGKQILEVAKFSGTISPAQLAYAMATFLMGNEGRASVFISPSYGSISTFAQISTVNAKLGTACGSYGTVANGNAYERKFTGGVIIVNPGGAGTVSVPLSHSYANLMGGSAVTGTLPVAPATAYILFTASNGCV